VRKATKIYQKEDLLMRKIHFVLAALLLVSLSTPALAQIRPGAFSVSPFVGGFLFDGGEYLDHRPVYGLRLGYDFTKNWGAEAVLDYVNTNYTPTNSSTNVYNYRLEGLYYFMPESKLVPFLAAGVGGMSIDYHDSTASKTRAVVDYGAGLKYFLFDWLALRGDVRHVLSFGSIHSNLEYTIGVTFYFGGRKPAVAPASAPKPAEEPKKAEAAAPPPVVAPPPAELDSDKDGVPDSRDKCPGTPAGVAVNSDGCPLDSDKDGVPDYLDKCPRTPPGVTVDSNGCPFDSDKDGVPDYLDKCPGTPAGTAVDKDGCPIPPQKVTMTFAIEFDSNKADIKSQYHEEIGRVADFMKKYPTTTGTIEGHTDNTGSAEMNQRLSQRRAESVKNYLVQKFGIDPARLTAKGYGMTQPIADNKTVEGRQKNRRIEATFEATVVKK
jgi:OOP family OmpA-OmpF porin